MMPPRPGDSRLLRGQEPRIAELLGGQLTPLERPRVLTKITDAAPIASTFYRWTYTVVERWWNPTTKLGELKSGGQTYTAFNVCELDNDSTHVGPELDPGDIPAGFTVLAAEGHVEIQAYRSSDGSLVWLFSKPNPIGGSCP
jgi:hypothetical protein